MPSVFVNELERAAFDGINAAAGVTVWPNRMGCELPRRRASVMATHRGLRVVLYVTKRHEPFEWTWRETTNPWSAYELTRQVRRKLRGAGRASA